MESKTCKLSISLKIFSMLTLVLGLIILGFWSFSIFLSRIHINDNTLIISILNILGFGGLFIFSIASTLHGLSILIDYKTNFIKNISDKKIKCLKIRAIMTTLTMVLYLIMFFMQITKFFSNKKAILELLFFLLPFYVYL